MRTEIAELRAKYEELVVQCEHLADKIDHIRVDKEYLTEEMKATARRVRRLDGIPGC